MFTIFVLFFLDDVSEKVLITAMVIDACIIIAGILTGGSILW